MSPFHPLRADARAQSEVLGVVLLVGIVVVATSTLAVYGSAAVASNEQRVAVERAANGLEQFDTRASRVAFGESDVQRVDVGVTGTSGSLDTRPNDGWIRIDVLHASNETVKREVVDQTLGALVYRSDDTTVAFQGGGVWRSDGEGSAMISRPEFHFEDGTLTLPIVVTEGDGAVYSDVQVRRGTVEEKKFPDHSRDLTNKVEDVMIRITVQSDYYEAWGRYIEAETGYGVALDHGAETATVIFDGLGTGFGRHGGIIATAEDGVVDFSGQGIKIDSYDSSGGSYDATKGSNGLIVAVNDIEIGGSADIDGDVAAGNDVTVTGDFNLTGTAYHNGTFTDKNGKFDGANKIITDVQTIAPIDTYVETVVKNARTTNDNGVAQADGVMDGNRLKDSGTLHAGVYYFEDLTVSKKETLTLDTTDGDIVIAVEDSVTIDGGGSSAQEAGIRVVGPGTVEVVVLGNDLKKNELHFSMDQNTFVVVPQENAGQFRVYGTQEFRAQLKGSSGGGEGKKDADDADQNLLFEGAIYAPAGLTGDGTITIGQGEFYGILVTGKLDIDQYASIHYDENLADDWFPGGPFSSNLEYLHVSVHRIEVTSR